MNGIQNLLLTSLYKAHYIFAVIVVDVASLQSIWIDFFFHQEVPKHWSNNNFLSSGTFYNIDWMSWNTFWLSFCNFIPVIEVNFTNDASHSEWSKQSFFSRLIFFSDIMIKMRIDWKLTVQNISNLNVFRSTALHRPIIETKAI